VVALSQVMTWYIWRARNKVRRNIPLPFAELDIHPMSQFFPVSILQGLLFHPWVRSKSQDLLVSLLETPGQTELNSLVMMLTQNDKAGDITGLKERAKVGSLCESGKQLLENQKLQNWLKGLLHENQKLMRTRGRVTSSSSTSSPSRSVSFTRLVTDNLLILLEVPTLTTRRVAG
jgi:hypothetical protein